MPKMISIHDLKSPLAVSLLCHNDHDPIFITSQDRADMVIMSMEAYEEKLALLDIYENVWIAEKEYENGNTFDAKQVLQELREKYCV